MLRKSIKAPPTWFYHDLISISSSKLCYVLLSRRCATILRRTTAAAISNGNAAPAAAQRDRADALHPTAAASATGAIVTAEASRDAAIAHVQVSACSMDSLTGLRQILTVSIHHRTPSGMYGGHYQPPPPQQQPPPPHLQRPQIDPHAMRSMHPQDYSSEKLNRIPFVLM